MTLSQFPTIIFYLCWNSAFPIIPNSYLTTGGAYAHYPYRGRFSFAAHAVQSRTGGKRNSCRDRTQLQRWPHGGPLFCGARSLLLADEAVQDFGGKIENILFLQQSEPGAPWQVLLHEPSMIREITFEMPEEEFRAMLAKNNLILPGDPGFVMP